MSELSLSDWRRQVFDLYAEVRAAPAPQAGHGRWRARRDELLREHPDSPVALDDPLRASGLSYWPYDARWRWNVPVVPLAAGTDPTLLTIHTGSEETTRLRRIGCVRLPAPLDATLDVWWLQQYGGGLFLPLRDGTAGTSTYGGGRYLLDTAKGADLGARDGRLTVDLNFLYHPSCRYDSRWLCPLAPPGNRVSVPVPAGERL